MKKIFILSILSILLAAFSGQISAYNNQAARRSIENSSLSPVNLNFTPLYPLKVSSNGRYLVDQNNQPVLISGDSPWSLIAQATNGDVDYYLNNRQQKGFDAILVNLIEHKFATQAPADITGDRPFTGANFTTPNEAYFAHADYVISGAAQRGITVFLDALYLGSGCGSEGWCAEVEAASTADMQAWGTYVGSRYKNFNNIVWVVGGDTDPSIVLSKVNAFANALQAADPRHLITFHDVRGSLATTHLSGSSWLTLNDIYTDYLGTVAYAQTAYNRSPTLPFFQIEAYYENEHSMIEQGLRAQAYWTVLSGGTGYMFGNCPVWGAGFSLSSYCSGTGDWKTELDNQGSVSMNHVQQLFNSVAWQNLVPDWGHTAVTAGYGSAGSANYVSAGISADGTLLVAYLPTNQAISVNLANFSSTVAGRWYDPTSGVFSGVNGAPFSNTGSQQFTPPGANSAGANDWVLVLQTSGSQGLPTATPTATLAPSHTPTPLPPTATPTHTLTPTKTVVQTSTRTPTRTKTVVQSSTPTSKPTKTFTRTPVTRTPTRAATHTPTPTRVATRTNTPTPSSTPATNGLVAAYSFNQGSGSVANDTSGNKNNGSISSPVWATAGKYGGALSFGTLAQCVVIPDSTSLNLTTGMTLEAWVYPTSGLTSGAWRSVMLKQQPSELVYSLYGNGTNNEPYIDIFSSGSERFTGGGGTLPLNTWTHLAATFDGSVLRLYKNGLQIASTNYSGSILTTTDPLYIGGDSVWPSEVFPGYIDEVRIYNRALSSAEIGTDMNTPIK